MCQECLGRGLTYLLHGKVRWQMAWSHSVEGWLPNPRLPSLSCFHLSVCLQTICQHRWLAQFSLLMVPSLLLISYSSIRFSHLHPDPPYFPVACSPGRFFIPQALLHVQTLCCYLRATRLGNCSQEADFLDLIFHCYVMIRQQHQDAFRKCWLRVVPCGRQHTLSDPFCKNLVGQIRPRHVES